MDFIGKICPFCKGELKEDDEVVICSVCEMPHHKECWIENQGCTTFGCTGTIMGIDGASFCEKCGAAYEKGEEFCSACGNRILKAEQQEVYFSNQQNNDYNLNNSRNIEDDIYTFVGVKQDYFLKKFKKLNNRKLKVSWNWASAFFGAYWYAYRKMYLNQFLYYVIYLFNAFFLGMLMFLRLFTSYTFSPVFGFIPFLILIIPFAISGLFGNYIYKRNVEKHIKRAESMEDYMRQNYLTKKGGVNVYVVIILIIISLLIRAIGRS